MSHIIFSESSGAERVFTIFDAEKNYKEFNWNFIVRHGKVLGACVTKEKMAKPRQE